ncbi:MAG: thioredoxin family protein [Planctomycetota bacterium]
MKKILILGTGCAKCKQLTELTKQVVERMGLPCEVEKVTDILRFADFGVMSTPALVVDGQVKAAGRVPTAAEIEKWLA